MRALQDAIVRLLKSRPFYGHLLLQCRRLERETGQPLGVTITSGGPVLGIRPDSFGGLDANQQQGLLEHCVKHLLHLHPVRRKGRHPLVWDAACDLAINHGSTGLAADILQPERFQFPDDLSAEEYYQLLSHRYDLGTQRGQGLGHADQADEGREEHGEALPDLEQLRAQLPDSHELWDAADSTPVRLAEETLRQLVHDAVRKTDGEVPGELRQLVDNLLTPAAIPWRQVLRQFVATAGRVGRKNSWSREHRRFQQDTPGTRKRRRLNLLVGVDVSDSTDQQPLREAFARELVWIARSRESQLTVLYAGSRIQKIDSFSSSEAVAEVYQGGGFTDLRPVFDYARQMPRPPAAVIYLTDGFGAAPAAMEFPTLWVLTKEGEKPADWGVELRLET
jgi:predicted metal-dependent peptidase